MTMDMQVLKERLREAFGNDSVKEAENDYVENFANYRRPFWRLTTNK